MNDTLFGAWLQFLGALLAAGVGVALWYLERRHQRATARQTNRVEREAYRKIISYAIEDLLKQTNYICHSLSLFVSDYSDVMSSYDRNAKIARTGLLETVRSKSIEVRLDIPNVLQLSLPHAKHLSTMENRLVAEAIALIGTLNAHLLDLSYATRSVSELVAPLDIVAGDANLLYKHLGALLVEVGAQGGGTE